MLCGLSPRSTCHTYMAETSKPGYFHFGNKVFLILLLIFHISYVFFNVSPLFFVIFFPMAKSPYSQLVVWHKCLWRKYLEQCAYVCGVCECMVCGRVQLRMCV